MRKKMNLEQWLKIWLENYAKVKIKLRTYSQYHDVIDRHIIPALGHYTLREIDTEILQRYIGALSAHGNLITGKGLAPAGVKVIVSILKCAMKDALNAGRIRQNPCLSLILPRGDQKKIDAFTREEQRAIERYIAGKDKYIGVLLCLYTGIRIGEMLSLSRQDVDLQRETLTIDKTVSRFKGADGRYIVHIDKPKTPYSERQIPIPEAIIPALRNYLRKAQGQTFLTSRKKRPMDMRSYQYIFKKMLELLGIRPLGFHSLRHTFATRALECGMDVKTLSEIMGHKNPVITMQKYAHSMTGHKKRMMNRMRGFEEEA